MKTAKKTQSAKKTVKKASPKKKAAKKPTKKASAKKKAKPGAKQVKGLRKPQVRILQALKTGKGMTRAQIADESSTDSAMLNSYIGAHKEEIRLANDAKNFPSLLTLKLVKAEIRDIDDRDTVVYTITALGRKKVTS